MLKSDGALIKVVCASKEAILKNSVVQEGLLVVTTAVARGFANVDIKVDHEVLELKKNDVNQVLNGFSDSHTFKCYKSIISFCANICIIHIGLTNIPISYLYCLRECLFYCIIYYNLCHFLRSSGSSSLDFLHRTILNGIALFR